MGSFEVFRPFNMDAEITGQEYTLDLTLPGDLITAGFCYSKLNPLNKSENVTTRDRILPYRPIESIKASLTFNIRGLFGAFRYRHVGKRFVNEANTVSMPAYQTVDADLSWTLAFRRLVITWKCSVYNLFNEKYEILRDMPLPLREWRAGLEFTIQP